MNAPLKHTNITAASEVDPRLAFMARAGAAHDLVVLGEVELDQAFDGLIDRLEQTMQYDCCPTCGASSCVNPSFCAAGREADQRATNKSERRKAETTAETTIEAIVYSVRERGLGALKEPANIARLKQCDDAARATIDRRIAKMFPEGGAA